jgi:hypothetical protein
MGRVLLPGNVGEVALHPFGYQKVRKSSVRADQF